MDERRALVEAAVAEAVAGQRSWAGHATMMVKVVAGEGQGEGGRRGIISCVTRANL